MFIHKLDTDLMTKISVAKLEIELVTEMYRLQYSDLFRDQFFGL